MPKGQPSEEVKWLERDKTWRFEAKAGRPRVKVSEEKERWAINAVGQEYLVWWDLGGHQAVDDERGDGQDQLAEERRNIDQDISEGEAVQKAGEAEERRDSEENSGSEWKADEDSNGELAARANPSLWKVESDEKTGSGEI